MDKVSAVETGIGIAAMLFFPTILIFNKYRSLKLKLIKNFYNNYTFTMSHNNFKLSELILNDKERVLSIYFFRRQVVNIILCILPIINVLSIFFILNTMFDSVKESNISLHDLKYLVFSTIFSIGIQLLLLFIIARWEALYEVLKEQT